MKIIIVITALVLAAFLGMQRLGKTHAVSDTGQYSLSNVEGTPIPNEVALVLWQEKARQFCSAYSANDVEITKRTAAQCAAEVNDKHVGCATKVGSDYPSLINNKTDLKHMGKAYFDCTLPKPVAG